MWSWMRSLAEQLATTTDKNDILNALNAAEQTSSEQLEDYSVTAEATVVDAQGMHARPASLISEQRGNIFRNGYPHSKRSEDGKLPNPWRHFCPWAQVMAMF